MRWQGRAARLDIGEGVARGPAGHHGVQRPQRGADLLRLVGAITSRAAPRSSGPSRRAAGPVSDRSIRRLVDRRPLPGRGDAVDADDADRTRAQPSAGPPRHEPRIAVATGLLGAGRPPRRRRGGSTGRRRSWSRSGRAWRRMPQRASSAMPISSAGSICAATIVAQAAAVILQLSGCSRSGVSRSGQQPMSCAVAMHVLKPGLVQAHLLGAHEGRHLAISTIFIVPGARP
jgi:hypothetical protein